MSQSIHWNAVNAEKFIQDILAIKQNDATGDDVHSVLCVGGDFLGEWFILLNCEAWGDVNPYYQTFSALDRLIGLGEDPADGTHDIWLRYLYDDHSAVGRDSGVEDYEFPGHPDYEPEESSDA